MLNSQQENQITSQLAKQRHILEEIVLHKQQEVNLMYEQLAFSDLKNQVTYAPIVRDFLAAIRQNPKKPSIIAEVKKASPSKGIIRDNFNPLEIALAYERGGASCISVLTDEKFFQGSFENLELIRSRVNIPLLCKEFIIDPYQIYFARLKGADAILLIAAILDNETIQDFLQIAHSLGMTVLVEVHTLNELDRVLAIPGINLVGINNRNLEDFVVDLATTEDLLLQRRDVLEKLEITVVSESGLYASSDLAFVLKAGAEAVLVGESLVRQDDVEQAIRQLFRG
ncbi:indole-3-glycerol phosphate synthase TrpC [Brunnivagina elsteri]|uniref:Indole-3-glycerol phosphate synthase n=1 Tax=Brunnivagina elsteri CCALA 953 TaxID=987040 RepID=A0A2A2TFQ4_9CYAN|nr:indole-3-glycerol phosphate synthase TrpC [Calothrix elsteri]PAX52562.1 indole-3-glycerol phosphate synthase [Calothrix elsteri CCALA 953]